MSCQRHPRNTLGPFYVEAGCCTACGVPEATAPDLFGWDSDLHCFVKRQPAGPHEVDRMLLTMIRSEMGCIRYSGEDTRIIRRLAEQGEGELSDVAPDSEIVRIHRDHVALRGLEMTATAETLMDDFIGHLRRQPVPERFKCTVLERSADRCDLRVSWFEDKFHPINFARSTAPTFDWL